MGVFDAMRRFSQSRLFIALSLSISSHIWLRHKAHTEQAQQAGTKKRRLNRARENGRKNRKRFKSSLSVGITKKWICRKGSRRQNYLKKNEQKTNEKTKSYKNLHICTVHSTAQRGAAPYSAAHGTARMCVVNDVWRNCKAATYTTKEVKKK